VATDVVGQVTAKMTTIDWVAGKVGAFAVESSRGSDSILVTLAARDANDQGPVDSLVDGGHLR